MRKKKVKKKRGLLVDPPKVLKCAQCANRIDFHTEIPGTVNAVCSYRCYERREARLTLDGYVQEKLPTAKAWQYQARYGCDTVTMFRQGEKRMMLVLYASVR